MKTVSFKVAKALKEAGFPQDYDRKQKGYIISNTIKWWKFDEDSPNDSAYLWGTKTAENNLIGLLVDDVPYPDKGHNNEYETIDAPTYVDAARWLIENKKIDKDQDKIRKILSFDREAFDTCLDPEAYIAFSIDKLVDNGLIK